MDFFLTYPTEISGGGGGVFSLNGQTGALSLVAGTNITITPGVGTLTIDSTGGGSGTVTSVGLSLPSIFTVSGSPVTTSGTLSATLNNAAANTIFSGPSTGVPATPTFRTLVAADIPALPYVSTSLLSARIIVGNASNVATAVAMTGNVTINNTGLTAISANAVQNNQFRASTGLSVVGRSANTSGNVADIVASADNQVLRRSGTTIGFGTIPIASLSDLQLFRTISTPFNGANVSATTSTDTTTFTTSTSTIQISGNAVSKVVQFEVPGALVHPRTDTTYEWVYSPDNAPEHNTAIGHLALQLDDSTLSASGNSAFGASAMAASTSSTNNASFGYLNLTALGSGDANACFGSLAGQSLQNGSSICLFGHRAGEFLQDSADGSFFMGAYAGGKLTFNYNLNMGVGTYALQELVSEDATHNLAIGHSSLLSLTGGSFNVAVGQQFALVSITGNCTGNTFVGSLSMLSLSSSNFNDNTIVGYNNLINFNGDTTGNSFYGSGLLGSVTTTITNAHIFGYNVGIAAGSISYCSLLCANSLNDANDLNFITGIGHNILYELTDGQHIVAIGNSAGGVLKTGNYGIALGDYATFRTTSASNQMVVGGSTAAGAWIDRYYFGNGGQADANPKGVTFSSTDASGTNIAGASFTIAGGLSTGTGAGGSVFFATSSAGSTGTALNTLTNAVQVDSSGNLKVLRIGAGLTVAEGSNAKMGTATLVAGTVVVSTTAVTANSRIFLTHQNSGGTPGFVRVSARTAGTSFTILSSSVLDTSSIAYMLVEPS